MFFRAIIRARSPLVLRAFPVCPAAGVCLGRHGVADVGQGEQDIHGAVLHAVLVAGDQRRTDLAVVPLLPLVVEGVGVTVHALQDAIADRAVLPQPHRSANDQDVAGIDFRLDLRPIVTLIPVDTRVILLQARGDLEIDGAQDFRGHAIGLEDPFRHLQQALGVGQPGERVRVQLSISTLRSS